MRANLNRLQNGIAKSLNAMVERAKAPEAYLTGVIWPKYQKAQLARWQSAGGSEGLPWKGLTKPYEKQKKRKFAAYDGGGNVVMVATGRLERAATGEDQGNILRLVTPSGMTISINTTQLPYAKYPGNMRPFMRFAPTTIADWKQGLVAYIGKGKQ